MWGRVTTIQGTLLALGLAGCSQLLSFDELGGDAGVPDGGPVDAACVEPVTVAAAPIPATVILAVDGSGSMTLPLGEQSRYQATALALAEVVGPLAPHVRFGVLVFASAPMCPGLTGTLPALDSLAQMAKLFASVAPTGQAPLAEAIAGATALGAGVAGGEPPPGPGRIIFITDSPPATCAETSNVGVAAEAARMAVAVGFPLRVVVLGTDLTDVDAQMIASAGAPPGTEGSFASVESPAQLVTELARSLDGLELCRFRPGDDRASDSIARVTLDGTALDPTAWSPDGADAVRLVGEACTAYLAAPPREARVALQPFCAP